MEKINQVAKEIAENFGYANNSTKEKFKYGEGARCVSVYESQNQVTLEVHSATWSCVLRFDMNGKFKMCVSVGEGSIDKSNKILTKINTP